MAKKKQTKSTGRKRVTFRLESEPGKQIAVAGTFNNWDVDKRFLKDKNNSGEYQAVMLLEPGTYEYKFYIDGNWSIDPKNPNFEANSMGTVNSVIVVE